MNRLNRSTHATAVTSGGAFARAVVGSALPNRPIIPFVEAAAQVRTSFEVLLSAGIRF